MIISTRGQSNSANDNSELGKTVLSFMIFCLYGGHKFVVKMMPVNKLDADFLLYIYSSNLINQLQNTGEKLVSIICDNNRVNQAYFKSLHTLQPGEQQTIYLSFLILSI